MLLTAPTGKARFGIGGATLHSIISLPINQSSLELRPFGPDALNAIYAKLMRLRYLIIIDYRGNFHGGIESVFVFRRTADTSF